MVRKLLFLCVSSVALSACQPGLTESAPVMAGQAAPITAQERQQGTQANPDLLAEFGGAYSGPQASYTESIGRKIAVQSGLYSSPGAFDVALLNSPINNRSEEHTSELQSLMRISYTVICLNKKTH